jgi:hypothetical protein
MRFSHAGSYNRLERGSILCDVGWEQEVEMTVGIPEGLYVIDISYWNKLIPKFEHLTPYYQLRPPLRSIC